MILHMPWKGLLQHSGNGVAVFLRVLFYQKIPDILPSSLEFSKFNE